MYITVGKLVSLMEEFAPRCLAADWDNVGLQVGDERAEVRRVLVTLEVTPAVLHEALMTNADLIITHHPLIFNPLRHIRFDEPLGALLRDLISNGIALLVAHTNLDACRGGVADILAERLGLVGLSPLAGNPEKLFKVVVFVPRTYMHDVRMALADAGAGWLGNYSHCSFRTLGQGTFKPLAGSSPFLGQVGQEEEVEEYRLETIVSETCLAKALAAMRKAHPYEEVAYDVYQLANEGAAVSFGRIGQLPQALSFQELSELIKQRLSVPALRAVCPKGEYLTVAVCPGAGAGFVAEAARRGADCLVTGDVKHHDARLAQDLGLTVFDAGHYATELPVVETLCSYLRDCLQGKKTVVASSTALTPPWQEV